jgi:isorenieratene synthase
MHFVFVILASLVSVAFAREAIVNIPPKNPNDPDRLPQGLVKKVLVVGGGLAGLSAALELADRGYQITIKEKEPYLGGKLFSKPVEIFPNQIFQVEHGFHGKFFMFIYIFILQNTLNEIFVFKAWFHNYFQFKDIRNRLNINSNFRKWDKVHFVYQSYLPEVLYSEGPYPLNLLGIINRSPNLKYSDIFKSFESLHDLMYFDFDKVFEKYDNISFAQWAQEKKVTKSFYDIIMQPALSVTLNEQGIFSAAEMLTFMQIYFLSNAQSDQREVTTKNFFDAILNPWEFYLLKNNAR